MDRQRFDSRLMILLSSLMMGGLLLAGASSQAAAQGEPTATPDAAGIIYVVVQPNDSLWALSAGAGISLQELLAYNNLTEDAIIQPGQKLIIGYGTPPPTATVELPTATPTATRLPPTATATAEPPPRTAICLQAFVDLDRDGAFDVGEPFRSQVAFTVFNQETVVGNYITDGLSEPYCLEALAPGDYKITRSIARDEILSTAGNWALTLTRGTVLNLEFGSYDAAGATATPTSTPASAVNPVENETIAPPPAESSPPENRRPGRLMTVGVVVVGILLLGGGLLLVRRPRPPVSDK